jgi:hypothetical protein
MSATLKLLNLTFSEKFSNELFHSLVYFISTMISNRVINYCITTKCIYLVVMCFDNFMNLVKDINAHCNIIYILFLIVLLITGLRWLG